MKRRQSRREFFGDVGRGMLVAGIGYHAALDLGLATPALAEQGDDRLTFGPLEPLVGRLQETPADRLVETAVGLLRDGTPLRDLVAAAALANTRTFGGEDYVGFHTLMAMTPAFTMAGELPEDRRALPVLKVLYRNTARIQEYGGPSKEVLRPVEPECCLPEGREPGDVLREAVRRKDMDGAERTFATIAQGTADEAFNALLFAVQDNTEVHRVVLPYRAFDLLSVVGPERAHTLLRQSVRYCVKSERDWKHTPEVDRPRVVLPKLCDQYKLDSWTPGRRRGDDAWVEQLSTTIFSGTPETAAEAVAAALAEGFAPSDVGEALALAANQLVLRDSGRTERDAQPGKPPGSVHGDSIGVHACDSANAWRNMARLSNPRNTAACLILGAFQVAYDRTNRGGAFLEWEPRPTAGERGSASGVEPDSLLSEAEAAIRSNDQARACALIDRYGRLGHPARPALDLLLGFAVSEDGALHAEKFYRTASEEFAAARPAFRWRHLAALARVTASEFGRPAPGISDARRLLGI